MRHILWLFVGISIILGLVLVFEVNFGEILTSFSMLTKSYLALLCLTFLIQIIALSNRWRLIVESLGHHVKWSTGYFLLTTTTGLLLSSILPSSVGGPGYRILSLKVDQEIPVGDATFTVTVDSLLGIAISAILLIPALLFLLNFISAIAAMFTMLSIVVGLVVLSTIKRRNVLGSVTYIFGKILSWIAKTRFISTRLKYRDLGFPNIVNVSSAHLIGLWIYSLSAYLSICLGSWIILVALAVKVDFVEYFVLFPLVSGAVIIAVTPAGIGIQEVVWVGVLSLLGVDGATATEYAIVRRVLYEVLLVGLGLPAFLIARRQERGYANKGG